MKVYATAKMAGLKFPARFPNDDPIQIGGDILLNASGSVEFAFNSKTAIDRLNSESVLKIIKEQPN